MSEMIERVARSLSFLQFGHEDAWEDQVDMARAAIEAMREPTNSMVKAHKGARYRANGQSASKTEAIREGHRAAIDAALSEKP